MKIAILAAMEEEMRSIREMIADPSVTDYSYHQVVQGVVQNHHIITMVTGEGKVLSAARTQWVIDHFQPNLLIFVGAAGALSPELAVGDIVIGTQFKQFDFDITALAIDGYEGEPWTKVYPQTLAYLQAKQDGKTYKLGSILTGDKSIADEQEKRTLVEAFSGDCIEMEGYSAAIVSKLNHTPFVVMRQITDVSDGDARADFAKNLAVVSASLWTLIVELFFDLDENDVGSWSQQ